MIRGFAPTLSSIYTDPALGDWPLATLHFYRYLYENDHVHELSGIGLVREEVMCAEVKMTADEIAAAKADIGDKVLWLPDGTYWVKARAKYACYRGPGDPIKSRAAEVRKLVKTLPDDLYAAFATKYPDIMAPPPPRKRTKSSSRESAAPKRHPTPAQPPPLPDAASVVATAEIGPAETPAADPEWSLPTPEPSAQVLGAAVGIAPAPAGRSIFIGPDAASLFREPSPPSAGQPRAAAILPDDPPPAKAMPSARIL